MIIFIGVEDRKTAGDCLNIFGMDKLVKDNHAEMILQNVKMVQPDPKRKLCMYCTFVVTCLS